MSAIRAAFKRAPWAFALAFLVTLASALPLSLLKIEVIPREVGWLETLVFVLFIFLPVIVLTSHRNAQLRQAAWHQGRGPADNHVRAQLQ